MVYFYARVSSKEQNLARQMEVSEQYKKPDRVFCDKASGKTFKRPAYEEMVSILQPGDEVVVKELDRLGRNKEGIKEEIQRMKAMGVTLRILDLPTTLIDFQGQAWLKEMVDNILIEVMSSMAEQEREKIRKRQREGIDAMRVVNGKRYSEKTGNFVGRPLSITPPSGVTPTAWFATFYGWYLTGEKSVKQICDEMGISRSTWYNLVRRYTV